MPPPTTDSEALNVVIVNDYARVNGGASKVAIRSARALAERGVKVHFFAAVGPVCDDLLGLENLQTTCLDLLPYNQSPFKRSVFSGLWDKAARNAFEILLARLPKQTVVHFHSNRDALSSSVFKPVFDTGIPLIYTCHEYGLACPYAVFYNHHRGLPCGKKALSLGCLAMHCNRKGYDKKIWTFARQMVQNTSLHLPQRIADIIYVSDFSRRILEPYVGPGVRQHQVSNPIDAVRGEQRKLTPDSPFIFVGFLTAAKGPVIAAAAAAKAGVPIRFVGEGEAREEILKANQYAKITGWLGPEQVHQEMLNARAIAMPALWYETQGMVVQEALALGVPAIVSRTTAASEAIIDGQTGLLSDTGSIEQVAEAMQKLTDDGLACEMGKAASAAYWANPSELTSHVDRILEIYYGALTK